MDQTAEDILKFWLDEVGEQGWFDPSDGLDDLIRERFGALWERARRGEFDGWTCEPRACLALLILLDQFPRNMFRGDPRSFASDGKALAIATRAIRRGFDRRVGGRERPFFYLPFTHSESVANQEKGMRLTLLSAGDPEQVRHSRAHRAVIRQFGRFPYRNAALGRRSTPEEAAFLEAGGYRLAYGQAAG